MIHALGDKLAALHIHDNDHRLDLHQLPLTMDIDFDAIVRALRAIDYRGYFTLEADRYLSAHKQDPFAGMQNMAAAAKRLADLFDRA